MTPLGIELRALNDALRPQASPAGGEGVPEAVFFILFKETAAPAHHAWREFKLLYSFTKGYVFRYVPQIT